MSFLCSLFDHKWKNWEFEKSNDCTMVRKCVRCETVRRKVEHSFSEWKENGSNREKVCTRCPITEKQVHTRCSKCGGTGITYYTGFEDVGYYPSNQPPDEAFEEQRCRSCDGTGKAWE